MFYILKNEFNGYLIAETKKIKKQLIFSFLIILMIL